MTIANAKIKALKQVLSDAGFEGASFKSKPYRHGAVGIETTYRDHRFCLLFGPKDPEWLAACTTEQLLGWAADVDRMSARRTKNRPRHDTAQATGGR